MLDFYLASGAAYPACETCGAQTEWLPLPGSGAVVSDDIPGGVWIHNGICNADGTPKRYDSHSSMRKAAAALGWRNHVERGVADKKDYDRLTKRV